MTKKHLKYEGETKLTDFSLEFIAMIKIGGAITDEKLSYLEQLNAIKKIYHQWAFKDLPNENIS